MEGSELKFLEACKSGTLKQVEEACTEDVDVNCCSVDTSRPGISLACERGDWKEAERIVEFLLSKNALPNIAGQDGWNTFHLACKYSSARVVTLLLDKHPRVQSSRSGSWSTPYGLFICSQRADDESINIVKVLLSRGCKTNQKNAHGTTALSLACLSGTFASVTELLFHDNKAEIETANDSGFNPLLFACQNKSHGAEIIQLLIESGAKTGVKTRAERNMASLLIMSGPALYHKAKHLIPNGMRAGDVLNCVADPIGSLTLYQNHGSDMADTFFCSSVEKGISDEIAWADLRLGLPLDFCTGRTDVFRVLEKSKKKRLWKWASLELPRQHPKSGETLLHLLCKTESLNLDEKLDVFNHFKMHYFNPLTPNFKNQLPIEIANDSRLIAAIREYMEWKPNRFVTEWFGPLFMSRAVTAMIIMTRHGLCKDVKNIIIRMLSKMENLYVPSKVTIY